MAKAEDLRVPFEPKDLEGKVGTLFYIALQSEEYRVSNAHDILEYCHKLNGRAGQALDALRGKVPNRAHNPREMYATDGDIIEVENIEPSAVEGWSLGEIRLAIYDDGAPVNEGIEGVYKDFIFALERAYVRPMRPPVLVGRGHPFSLHAGEIYAPLLRRIIVEMADIPAYKAKGTIMCFGGGGGIEDSPVVKYARKLLASAPDPAPGIPQEKPRGI